jgi:hypothetical protein
VEKVYRYTPSHAVSSDKVKLLEENGSSTLLFFQKMSIISFVSQVASTYREPNSPQNNHNFGTYGESFPPYDDFGKKNFRYDAEHDFQSPCNKENI